MDAERQQGSLNVAVQVIREPSSLKIHMHRPWDAKRLMPARANDVLETQITVDLPSLRRLEGDATAYGRAISQQFFAEERLRDFFSNAVAENGNTPALRWIIDPGWPALHDVAWETLVHPQSGKLFASHNAVSRLVYSDSAHLQRRNNFRAVVVGGPGPGTETQANRVAERVHGELLIPQQF
jgi:hypothetical protein